MSGMVPRHDLGTQMESNGRNLVDHWSWAAEKGLMNKHTATSLRVASSQVLGVLDSWENVDVTKLDIEETLKRFQNLRKKDFKPKNLEVYKRRFRQAVSSYLSYLEDPGAWRPSSQERPAKSERVTERDRQPAVASSAARVDTIKGGLVDYPYPLREGQTARLSLPRDLKMAEVKRLNAFMSTLAVDFDQARS